MQADSCPPPHLPFDELLSGEVTSQQYLSTFDGTGVSIAGLNCNGNPLHPDPEVGPEDAEDLRNAIRVAGLLGVDRVVTMSGLPQAHPGGKWPAWHVNTWDSGYLDSLDYQWDEIAAPFWTEIDTLARETRSEGRHRDAPAELVFNAPTHEKARRKDRGHPRGSGDGPVTPVLARHRPRRTPSNGWGRWCFTPPQRTCASMKTARSTGFSTTGSREFRLTRTRPVSAGDTS